MTAAREVGGCNKHSSPSIDEIVLSQIRQKLAEKRRETSTFDKKETHKCLRNYEDKLVTSPNMHNYKHFTHRHHHNSKKEFSSNDHGKNNDSNQESTLRELEPFLTYAAELTHDCDNENNQNSNNNISITNGNSKCKECTHNNNTKSNNEIVDQPIYESQSPIQSSREMIKNYKLHRHNHINKVPLIDKQTELKEKVIEEHKHELTHSDNTNTSKETCSSLVSNGTNNISAHSFMRVSSITSLITTNSRSTTAQNNRYGRRKSSKIYDHHEQRKSKKESQEELANVLLATAEEHLECEKEQQHRRLSRLNSINTNIHQNNRLSIISYKSTCDYSHGSREKNGLVNIDTTIPITSMNVSSSNSHPLPERMSILSSSDFMLANHDKKKNNRNSVFKYRYDTTNTTSNSSRSTVKMSNSAPCNQNIINKSNSNNNDISLSTSKKLPLNRNFVFPSDISVHENISVKGITSSSEKLNSSVHHASQESNIIINNSDAINYPSRSSRYSRTMLLQSNDSVNIGSDESNSRNYVTTTSCSNSNDNKNSNKSTTLPVKTLSPRELSEAFYRKGSGGVMAAAAYAHFLNENKYSGTHNKSRQTSRIEAMKMRNSTCNVVDNDKENVWKTSYDALLDNSNNSTLNCISKSNGVDDKQLDSLNRCKDTNETINTGSSAGTDEKDTKIQELLAQSRALYLQKCK